MYWVDVGLGCWPLAVRFAEVVRCRRIVIDQGFGLGLVSSCIIIMGLKTGVLAAHNRLSLTAFGSRK